MTVGVDAAIVGAVADAYGLGCLRAVTQFESYGNDNWLIVEPSSGDRYVLRRCANASLDRLEFQLALQRHLNGHGFASPAITRTTSQRAFMTDRNGTTWMLFAYVEGQEYNFGRAAQAVEAGRTLARFHLITESFSAVGPPPSHKASIRSCWANATQDVRELGELFPARVSEELALLSASWASALDVLPTERLEALPSGWLHGDFHGRNLVFDGDRIVGVFDFDDVDRGPYVYDVAAGVVKFARERRGSLALRPEFARCFLEGYESLRRLNAEERAALPAMAAIGYPPHARHYGYLREWRGEDIEGRLRRDVATMLVVRTEMERIGGMLFR